LILGATLLGLQSRGAVVSKGYGWEEGIHCRLGDTDWRVERVDRSPDVILYGALKFEPAYVEDVDLLAPSTTSESSCGPAEEEFSGCRLPAYPADAGSVGYFARCKARLLRGFGPGVVDHGRFCHHLYRWACGHCHICHPHGKTVPPVNSPQE
jgi:hypothetical protein